MNIDTALAQLDLYKEAGESEFFKFRIGIWNKHMRIYISKGNQRKDVKDKLLFNMVLMHKNARMFEEDFEEIIKSKEPLSLSYDLLSPTWENDKMIKDAKQLTGKLGIAKVKNKEGLLINVLFVITPQNVKYLFPLLPTPYVRVVRNNVEVTDKIKLTDKWTSMYHNTFKAVLDMIPEAYSEEVPMDASKRKPVAQNNNSYTKKDNEVKNNNGTSALDNA